MSKWVIINEGTLSHTYVNTQIIEHTHTHTHTHKHTHTHLHTHTCVCRYPWTLNLVSQVGCVSHQPHAWNDGEVRDVLLLLLLYDSQKGRTSPQACSHRWFSSGWSCTCCSSSAADGLNTSPLDPSPCPCLATCCTCARSIPWETWRGWDPRIMCYMPTFNHPQGCVHLMGHSEQQRTCYLLTCCSLYSLDQCFFSTSE